MAKETRKERLLRLAQEAHELDDTLQVTESRIMDVVHEIKSMRPNKNDVEEHDLQYLFDCYYIV